MIDDSGKETMLIIVGSWILIGILPAIPHLIGWKKGEEYAGKVIDYLGETGKIAFQIIIGLILMYIIAGGFDGN